MDPDKHRPPPPFGGDHESWPKEIDPDDPRKMYYWGGSPPRLTRSGIMINPPPARPARVWPNALVVVMLADEDRVVYGMLPKDELGRLVTKERRSQGCTAVFGRDAKLDGYPTLDALRRNEAVWIDIPPPGPFSSVHVVSLAK